MNLVLVEPGELASSATDAVVVVTGERARHITAVLRAAIGSRVRVGVIDGGVGDGEVTAIDGASVTLRVAIGPPLPRAPLDVMLALPRPKVLGRLYSPLAQLGVDRLLLVGAERVERSYWDAHHVTDAYARAHLLEGLAQARDTQLPRVVRHRSLRWALEHEVSSQSVRLVADPGAHPPPSELLARERPAHVTIALGPEGGLLDHERASFADAGWIATSLGPRTLRTDVAAIALVAAVHAALRPRE